MYYYSGLHPFLAVTDFFSEASAPLDPLSRAIGELLDLHREKEGKFRGFQAHKTDVRVVLFLVNCGRPDVSLYSCLPS
jgi:hypothetical protein